MSKELYLHQSRRLAKIVRSLIGKSCWTNYTAWEYKFNGIELNLTYTNDWSKTKRFCFVERWTRKLLLKTDSVKEAVEFIKANKTQ